MPKQTSASAKSDSQSITDTKIVGEKRKLTRHDVLARQAPKKRAAPALLIAYDFETTRIKPGTPDPLYLTAYHEKLGFSLESSIKGIPHLLWLLETYFLVDQMVGAKFVAWNANNFDVYFVAAALVTSPEWIMRPYMTGAKTVRGLKVMRASEYNPHDDEANKSIASWEFVDGMAQLGLVGVSLEKFLDNFAPDHKKLKGAINFEAGEEFDSTNQKHCDYAMRDSVGLYHAINNAQRIILERFNQPLRVTMGAVCIRILTANLPAQVKIYKPDEDLRRVIQQYVMRGGFCYCVRPFHGKVWKYDLNQAYAAAMRDARLPCGNVYHRDRGLHIAAIVFIVQIEAWNAHNRIPFYCRTFIHGKFSSVFQLTYISETWITSIEYAQLQAEGWRIEIKKSWYWETSFDMRDYVDSLERGRMTAEGGPSGPIGTTYKNIGNHSYGKTVEDLEPVEYILAKECPDKFMPHYTELMADPLENVYFRQIDPIEKNYHQPQIGAFVTAHVRMVIRRVALIDPDAWLYADTDCAVFSRDVSAQLDIHPTRYGAWKIESDGVDHKIIAKKVYLNTEDGKGHSKGLNVKRLTTDDFHAWFAGDAPIQDQVQRNNFIKVMNGAEMFRAQTRRGTETAVKRRARILEERAIAKAAKKAERDSERQLVLEQANA